MINFSTFTKLGKLCRQFGQINCCHRLWKVAQSATNRPIWSHWLLLLFSRLFNVDYGDGGTFDGHCELNNYFERCLKMVKQKTQNLFGIKLNSDFSAFNYHCTAMFDNCNAYAYAWVFWYRSTLIKVIYAVGTIL